MNITPAQLPIEDFIDLAKMKKIKVNMNNPFPQRDSFLKWVNAKTQRIEVILNSIAQGFLAQGCKN